MHLMIQSFFLLLLLIAITVNKSQDILFLLLVFIIIIIIITGLCSQLQCNSKKSHSFFRMKCSVLDRRLCRESKALSYHIIYPRFVVDIIKRTLTFYGQSSVIHWTVSRMVYQMLPRVATNGWCISFTYARKTAKTRLEHQNQKRDTRIFNFPNYSGEIVRGKFCFINQGYFAIL